MNTQLPTLSFESADFTVLWAEDWWDGIISGVAILNGRRVYFECISENDDGSRIFAVYDVPEEVWQQIDARHTDFQRYVGTHYDFMMQDTDTLKRVGNPLPRAEHSKFYEKWKNIKIKMDEKWQIAVLENSRHQF